MAMQIDTGDEKARRSDVFHVRPSAVEVDWTLNGRTDPVSDEDVAKLASDMTANGQIQPVTVRRLPSKKVKIVAGYTRLRAALMIEEDDPKFRLAARVVEINDEEAFLVNVRENLVRNDTTPIDNAMNMRRLIENYGYDKAKVGQLFKLSPTAVENSLKLLSLPNAVRARISAGTLAPSAALKLIGMDDRAMESTLRDAESVTGTKAETKDGPSQDGPSQDGPSQDGPSTPMPAPQKVITGTQVANAARKRGVKVGRTLSDLRRFLDNRPDELSKMLLKFIAGDVEERDLAKALEVIREGE